MSDKESNLRIAESITFVYANGGDRWLDENSPLKLAVSSCLLYVAYTISVGGDFMSGRFFAMPFLVSVVVALNAAKGLEQKGHPTHD